MMEDKEKQIRSKKRISQFGEVLTSKREVLEMLNLVKDETTRLESRFLEPACGDGNFLSEVLNLKLNSLEKDFVKNKYEFEKISIIIFGSIYGIDILKDNVIIARNRLYDQYLEIYNKNFKNDDNPKLFKCIKYILDKNIIHADALSLKQVNKNNFIIFSEWSLVNDKIKRRDFEFKNLLEYASFDKDTLFSDLGDKFIIPSPTKEYPLIHFLDIFLENDR